jgi:hypothetical protein
LRVFPEMGVYEYGIRVSRLVYPPPFALILTPQKLPFLDPSFGRGGKMGDFGGSQNGGSQFCQEKTRVRIEWGQNIVKSPPSPLKKGVLGEFAMANPSKTPSKRGSLPPDPKKPFRRVFFWGPEGGGVLGGGFLYDPHQKRAPPFLIQK